MADVVANVADGLATGSMYLVVSFSFWFCDDEQNLIPYVSQMVFAYVSVQGWIVDPYV